METNTLRCIQIMLRKIYCKIFHRILRTVRKQNRQWINMNKILIHNLDSVYLILLHLKIRQELDCKPLLMQLVNRKHKFWALLSILCVRLKEACSLLPTCLKNLAKLNSIWTPIICVLHNFSLISNTAKIMVQLKIKSDPKS